MTETLNAAWMNAPPTAAVMAALEATGAGAARFVGGCVRDTVLGRPVGDIDIATRLLPNQVIATLKAAGLKAVPTGIEHGTVTAIAHGRPFEITTLRRDVETDGRHAVVAFTDDWAEDAARRDFRLNALYLEASGRLHDPCGGGVDDARAGRIVFVGEATTRIREDYLRILRFFRFFAWYGRGPADADGLAACKALAGGVAGLSGERLAKELLKLFAAPDPRPATRLMVEAGVLDHILPRPANPLRFEAVVELSDDPLLRLAALLPGERAAVLEAAMRLRLSNADRDRLLASVADDGLTRSGLSAVEARRALYRLGPGALRDRGLLGAAGDRDPAAWSALLDAAATDAAPVLPVKGADAKALGVAPGPAIGRLLAEVEAWWIEQDFRPDRAAVLERLAVLARGEP